MVCFYTNEQLVIGNLCELHIIYVLPIIYSTSMDIQSK